MRLQTKALYNLMRFNLLEDASLECEPWQIEDLRQESSEDLFRRVSDFGIELDKQQFLLYAENCDTPEDLVECLLVENEDVSVHDQVYLLIFELWRKLLPDEQTLSVFCDELDFLIFKYDHGDLENDEPLQDALANLEEILDENADIGAEPTEIFQSLSEYCAHDLESFLYDYISEQIDIGNHFYASELLDGFYPFMNELKWFDFLKARLLSATDISEANELIRKVISEDPNLDLQIEILRFMVQAGDRDLFIKLVRETMPQLKTEEDFKELMDVVAEFYRRLDKEDAEKAIQNIMNRRENLVSSQYLDRQDPDLKAFDAILI